MSNTYSADINGDLSYERYDGRWTIKAGSLVSAEGTDSDTVTLDYDKINWDNFVLKEDEPGRARFENVCTSEFGSYQMRESIQYKTVAQRNATKSLQAAAGELPADKSSLAAVTSVRVPLIAVNNQLGERQVAAGTAVLTLSLPNDPKFNTAATVKFMLNRVVAAVLDGPVSNLIMDATRRQEELRDDIVVPSDFRTRSSSESI